MARISIVYLEIIHQLNHFDFYIYFQDNQSSEFLVADLIRSWILIHSSYFLIFSLLSFVGTSVKYLFQLIFSIFPFTYLKIRYERFTQ